MSEECLAFFELLEPFGPENEIPVFTDTTARIVDCKRVGKGAEHLQVAIRGSYANYKGIGFGLVFSTFTIYASNSSLEDTINGIDLTRPESFLESRQDFQLV